ncbi:MAG: inorganic diphosphatase [Legionella sp.]|nr:inorganic diphosphatase [Legionella sp.]
MSLMHVSAGSKIPHEFNVIIEIPMNGKTVKYEVDKDTGTVHVDRLMATAMHYPANYGFIPQTLSEDGDPVDVLVLTPEPLFPGAVIACRPVGVLKMTDESGIDAKILAVPIRKITKLYDAIHTQEDLPIPFLKSIEHFFQHYKDLEEGKWVKIDGWEGPETALEEVEKSVVRAGKQP